MKLNIENIIDEKLIELNTEVPEFFTRLEKAINECFVNYFESMNKSYQFTPNFEPVDFVIGGGAIKHIIDNEIHQRGKTVEAILSSTDIDVFIYNYKHINFGDFSSFLKNAFANTQEEVFDIHTNYFTSFKLEAMYKGEFEGVKTELLFTNPKRVQSFDINNRNVFFKNGKFLGTPSALEDIREKRILVTSVHTPVNSLIRSLVFSYQEGYKIEPVSIKLLKHFIKELQVDVSPEKIATIINRRKTSDEIKIAVERDFKNLIAETDLFIEEKYIVTYENNYLMNNHYFSKFSEVEKCISELKEDENVTNIKYERLDFYHVKKEAQGYEYPFHPDTQFHIESVDEYFDSTEDSIALYWTKTMYDAISTYEETKEDKFAAFKKDFDVKFKLDIKKYLSLENIYKSMYQPIVQLYNDSLLNCLVNFKPSDAFKVTYHDSSRVKFNEMISALNKDNESYESYNAVLFSSFFEKELSFEEIKHHLLEVDFLTQCYFILSTIDNVTRKEDGVFSFLELNKEDEEFSENINLLLKMVEVLIYNVHFNYYYVCSDRFLTLEDYRDAPAPIGHYEDIYSNLNFNKREFSFYRGLQNIDELVVSESIPNGEFVEPLESEEGPESITKTNLIGELTFSLDVTSNKLTSNGFKTGNWDMSLYERSYEILEEHGDGVFKETIATGSNYETISSIFEKEFLDKGFYDLIGLSGYVIQQMLITKYPSIFADATNETRIGADYNLNNIGNDHFFFSSYHGSSHRKINFDKQQDYKQFIKDCITF